MIRGRTQSEATSALLNQAIVWLVETIERAVLKPTAPQSVQPIGRRAKVNDILEETVGLRPILERRVATTESTRTPTRLDRRQVDRHAREFSSRPPTVVVPPEATGSDLVGVICTSWGYPEAADLGCAWLQGDKTEIEDVNMETKTIMLLVGAAAAAAVLALVLLARRNGAATLQGREQRVSRDFAALQKVRDQGGPAAVIALRLIDDERSPWTFDIEHSLGVLSGLDQRVLLAALAPLGVGVELIAPAAGDAFDTALMNSSVFVDDGSRWVVACPTPDDRIGFRRGSQVLFRAEVSTCTADWWCLTIADPDCPVGAAVRADPDRYTGLDRDYAGSWSVIQGFSAFADLRQEFDEKTLASWSERLRERLSGWYSLASGRRPVTFGAFNDRYDPSIMKARDSAPEADSRVISVEERDGLPQAGLGCIGAPPLLYAVVRVEEA